jgi:hypothetical protein
MWNVLLWVQARECDIFSAEVRWAALSRQCQQCTLFACSGSEGLTICSAGLSTSSSFSCSPRSQQRSMLRNQSPIFSPKLLFVAVVAVWDMARQGRYRSRDEGLSKNTTRRWRSADAVSDWGEVVVFPGLAGCLTMGVLGWTIGRL